MRRFRTGAGRGRDGTAPDFQESRKQIYIDCWWNLIQSGRFGYCGEVFGPADGCHAIKLLLIEQYLNRADTELSCNCYKGALSDSPSPQGGGYDEFRTGSSPNAEVHPDDVGSSSCCCDVPPVPQPHATRSASSVLRPFFRSPLLLPNVSARAVSSRRRSLSPPARVAA